MNNNNNSKALQSQYQESSIRLRAAWMEYKESEKPVRYEIVNMVKILENDGYPREKAIQKIIADHKDLDGLSRATIYRELPENMKDQTRGKPKKSLGQPNISREILGQPNPELEDFRNTKGTKVPPGEGEQQEEDFKIPDEDEKYDKEIEQEEEEPEEEQEPQEEQQDTIYDKDFVENLIKENEELKQENTKLKKPFNFNYDLEIKTEILPLKVEVYPQESTGTVRVRKK